MELLKTAQQFSFDWLMDSGPIILAIIIGFYIVHRFAKLIIEKFIRRAVKSRGLSRDAEEKRENTLIRTFGVAFNALVFIVTGMLILSEIGLDIAPLLAAAGVAGVAIGFGAQYIIRDLLTGFFIIMENQYRVGDVVCLGTTCGSVEDITPRITVLRDLDGTAHHIPNGEITIASNLTKSYANVNINIGIAYESDLEKVIKVVNSVGDKLAQDEEWKDQIIEPPQFKRVDDFADSAIVIKILGKTEPLKQWGVAGELRKRLKIEFDKQKIVIPFPQRVVHMTKS